jgi:hypothetical protein
MHPNVFLKTFWRMELKPQVFVAMSFHGTYQQRYQNVIKPAIERIPLAACRVDNSKTGDSILTDIMDGIAHSQLVLADVSTMMQDNNTAYAYRNGNVMYEVGLALACRQPSEVLLIRDDNDSFLFDVSTIPHIYIDFNDEPSAVSVLHQRLLERLREQQFVHDARIEMIINGLSTIDFKELKQFAEKPPNTAYGRSLDLESSLSFPRLLDKQLIKCVGYFEETDCPAYIITPLGRIIVERVTVMSKFKDVKVEKLNDKPKYYPIVSEEKSIAVLDPHAPPSSPPSSSNGENVLPLIQEEKKGMGEKGNY